MAHLDGRVRRVEAPKLVLEAGRPRGGPQLGARGETLADSEAVGLVADIRLAERAEDVWHDLGPEGAPGEPNGEVGLLDGIPAVGHPVVPVEGLPDGTAQREPRGGRLLRWAAAGQDGPAEDG